MRIYFNGHDVTNTVEKDRRKRSHAAKKGWQRRRMRKLKKDMTAALVVTLAFLAVMGVARAHETHQEAYALSYTAPEEPSPIVPAPAGVSATTSAAGSEKDVPPVLESIAHCESNGQHSVNGQVVRGRENPNDIGKWQINQTIWAEKAEKLGYDIYTKEGNTAMALWLYENYGAEPWYLSANCHGYE